MRCLGHRWAGHPAHARQRSETAQDVSRLRLTEGSRVGSPVIAWNRPWAWLQLQPAHSEGSGDTTRVNRNLVRDAEHLDRIRQIANIGYWIRRDGRSRERDVDAVTGLVRVLAMLGLVATHTEHVQILIPLRPQPLVRPMMHLKIPPRVAPRAPIRRTGQCAIPLRSPLRRFQIGQIIGRVFASGTNWLVYIRRVQRLVHWITPVRSLFPAYCSLRIGFPFLPFTSSVKASRGFPFGKPEMAFCQDFFWWMPFGGFHRNQLWIQSH